MKNPLHLYTNSGTYSVSLTVTTPGGQSIITKNNYITVSGICTDLPVTISDTNAYYPSIGSALGVAVNGDAIMIQGTNLTESPTTSQDISLMLSGGYSCDYSMNPGFSVIRGAMTIGKGTMTIENIIIQ